MNEQEDLREDSPPNESDAEADRLPNVEWEENEPSPHQGEQGQENEL
jgi:hypothetical protein